jgi:hypothetical protein
MRLAARTAKSRHCCRRSNTEHRTAAPVRDVARIGPLTG